MIFYFSKISKSIDPFQSFTTFNGKSVSSLKKLSFNKLYVESFKQVFTLRKNIYIFVVVCYSLVEQIPLSTMAHTLHDIFLPVHDLIRLFFENMALEMVFMVRLPRLRTHIAKAFTTSTCHEVTPHRSLNRFFAPRTNLGIGSYPLCICFLWKNLLYPFLFLIAFTGIMIITLTFKAKNFSASTLDGINI